MSLDVLDKSLECIDRRCKIAILLTSSMTATCLTQDVPGLYREGQMHYIHSSRLQRLSVFWVQGGWLLYVKGGCSWCGGWWSVPSVGRSLVSRNHSSLCLLLTTVCDGHICTHVCTYAHTLPQSPHLLNEFRAVPKPPHCYSLTDYRDVW